MPEGEGAIYAERTCLPGILPSGSDKGTIKPMTTSNLRKRMLATGSALQAVALLGAGVAAGTVAIAPAAAQDYTSGAISGQVTDESGAPISGATVTVTSNDTGVSRTTTSAANGSFRIAALPVGNYDIVVDAGGYDNFTGSGVAILGSQTATVEIPMTQTGSAIVVTGSRIIRDFSGTTTGLNVDVEELAKTVPVSRDLTSVMLLAPGTTKGDSAFGNLASIGGSSVAENAYYLNGLNITNFDNYLGSARVPFEFYRSIEVKSGGYPAEFGRATGGIVNAVTKSGGNEFTAALHLNWEPDFLKSEGKNLTSCSYVDSTDPTLGVNCSNSTYRAADEADSYSAVAELGGPIIKDRLFFYGLVEFRESESTTINLNSGLAIHDKQNDPFWGIKLDAYPIDGHHLEFTMFDTTRTTRRDYYSYSIENGQGLAGSVQDFNFGGRSYVAKYTGNLTDFLTVSGAYGKMKDNFENVGVAGDAALPAVRNFGSSVFLSDGTEVPYLGFTNGQASASTSSPYKTEREFYRADVDLYFQAFGEHHLRVGFDQEDNTLQEAAVRTGGQYLLDRGILTQEAFSAGYGNAGLYYQLLTPTILQINYFNSSGQFKARNRAFYAQDEWTPIEGLTLSLGVRRDDFIVKKADGSDYVTQKDNWAPRLGLTFDVFPEMNGQFKAFYGQYYLPFASNTAFRQVGSEIYVRERFYYDGFDGDGIPVLTGQFTGSASYQGNCPIDLTTYAFSTGTYCNVTGNGEVAPSTALIDANLKATKQTEWILGYEQDIGQFRAGISYIHRELNRTAEDVAIDEAVNKYCVDQGITGCSSTWTGFHQYVITNPGSDMTVALDGLDGRVVTFSAEDLGYPKAKRTYDAVEFTFERPFDGVWTMGGSYTWSKSKGNSEGFVQSDFGQDDAGITQDFDQPGFTDGAYGYLPNDRRHRFKFWGAYKFDNKFTVGLNGSVSSPRSLSCFGYDPRANFLTPNDPYSAFGNAYGAASHFCDGELSPRGTAQKSDWVSNFDLKFAYEVPIGGERGLTLRADVFNLFNSQAVQARNEIGDFDNGTDYIPAPSYGLPATYQTPRYVRLGLDIEF